MSEDVVSRFEVKFTYTQTITVSPDMLKSLVSDDRTGALAAEDAAIDVLYEAPGFDDLPDVVVDNMTVTGVVEERPTDDGWETHHHRAQKSAGVFDRFAKVDPECPYCGSSTFDPSGRFTWTGDDGGVVNVTCEDCHDSFTIQFRAVDVAWADENANQHEAVAEGLLSPTYLAYPHADEYAHDGWEEGDDD